MSGHGIVLICRATVPRSSEGMGGDYGEESLTEAGGADADGAADIGEVLLAPHQTRYVTLPEFVLSEPGRGDFGK